MLVGVLVCAAAACSTPRAVSEDPGSTTTTGPTTTTAPTTTSGVVDAPLTEDQVWVLGDDTLTFVRIEPDKAIPLGASYDDVAPLAPGTRLLVRYTTPAGGAVYLEQGTLVDPDAAIEHIAPRWNRAAADPPFSITPSVPGQAPTLTTVVGGRRVVISAAEDQLRPLMATLQAVDRTALDAMVHEISAAAVREGEAQTVVDGITLHLPPSGETVACLDGREPEGCAIADPYGPMVVASIPLDGTYVVVGCIFRQPVPVTEVVVNDVPRPVNAAPCGAAFSAPDVPPGALTIAFDDGPGGVGTYTLGLP